MSTKDNTSNKTQKKVGKAILQYGLIQANEKILVGLSGGIDSMSLLHLLKKRQQILPFPITLEAAHVSIDGVPNQVNIEGIRSFCQQHNIKLHELKSTIDYSTDKRNSPCYLCSSYRRNTIFKFAAHNNFHKLAFGHHMDDILETLLMNMISQSEISAMPPLLPLSNWSFQLIRPLALLQKVEIVAYAQANNIQPAEGSCEHEQKNSRSDVGTLLDQLVAINPRAKSNLFNSMNNIAHDYLPKKIT